MDKMAKKKKTTSKSNKLTEYHKLKEYQGYKLSDKVVCNRFPDGKLSYGKIIKLHLDEKSGVPCFSFACEMTGQHRLAMFDQIISDPTKQQMATVKKQSAGLYPRRK